VSRPRGSRRKRGNFIVLAGYVNAAADARADLPLTALTERSK
jgi:hypothetical protein